MLFINRLVLIGLLGAGITAATTAQAAVKLFTAEWYTESFGNECDGTKYTTAGNFLYSPDGGPDTKCTRLTPDFSKYSVFAVPMGFQCNVDNPRCPISSTPTSMGKFHPLGGFTPMDTSLQPKYCANLSTYGGGTITRPAKGGTAQGTKTFRIPPVYKNLLFFTPSGQPRTTECNATSTGYFTSTQTRFGRDKGKVGNGRPITGYWGANATASGFTIPAGPPNPGHKSVGLRTTSLVGQVANDYPYIYSYTYGTVTNDRGVFGPGKGAGGFTYQYTLGTPLSIAASIMVTAGKNKFGGTMKMLGAMTTKVCYWLQAGGGGCSLGVQDWRYDAIGAPAQTMGGVVTMGNIYTNYTKYYNTAQGAYSAITVIGSRFPWTTGRATITAVARGPHKTVHFAEGYDNRNASLGKGTIQLVSPIITRWFGYTDYETAGVAILRIKFVPEPQTWAILLAGVSLLGVGYRMRGR
jgi:hypothetical protein